MNFRRPSDPGPSGSPEDISNREDPYNVTQASRIYFLPNLMTAGNLFCGFMAIVSCIQARLAETALSQVYLGHSNADHYRHAVFLIFGAAVFDALDGRLARMGGRESLFGAEFDSLADVVSFGLAPALLMFYLILSPSQGQLWFRDIGWFIGFVYLLCAAMRLARFNVITNPLLRPGTKESSKDFVGLPVPAAAATVASLVLLLLDFAEHDRSLQNWALTLPFLMLLVAVLMVSTVRYPSGKKIDLQTRMRLWHFIFALVVIVVILEFYQVAIFCACIAYIFFGLFRNVRRARVAAKARHANPPTNTV